MAEHSVIGLCGSLRAESFNRKLLLEAARIYDAQDFVEVSLRFPLYDGDLERDDGIPADVQALADQIRAADGVIIATPEYNKMISGVLKNALDWLSRVDGPVWLNKPVAIMSATAGRTGGEVSLFTLRHALAPFRPRLHVASATMVAGAFKEFTDDGRLSSDHYLKTLTDQMAALRSQINTGN